MPSIACRFHALTCVGCNKVLKGRKTRSAGSGLPPVDETRWTMIQKNYPNELERRRLEDLAEAAKEAGSASSGPGFGGGGSSSNTAADAKLTEERRLNDEAVRKSQNVVDSTNGEMRKMMEEKQTQFEQERQKQEAANFERLKELDDPDMKEALARAAKVAADEKASQEFIRQLQAAEGGALRIARLSYEHVDRVLVRLVVYRPGLLVGDREPRVGFDDRRC